MCFLASSVYAFSPPAFRGDVLDETGTLTSEQISALKQRILELRNNDGIWAAVYLTKSLQDSSIEEAAVNTFEKWKLGQKGKDNGLLVIIAPTERKIRIEVGYGLEGTLTDITSKHIIADIYTPAFRDQRFAEGLLDGFDFMSRLMRNEVTAQEMQSAEQGGAGADKNIEIDWDSLFPLFFGVWLANLCVPTIYWLIQRRRKNKAGADDKVKTAFTLFAFLGFFFAIFSAVFGLAFADDPSVVRGVWAANALVDLIFFLPILLLGKTSRSGSNFTSSESGTSTSSSSSSSSDSSSSSSSSGGGSSGGGGASGNY